MLKLYHSIVFLVINFGIIYWKEILKDAWEGQRSLRFLTVKHSSCRRVIL